MTEYQETMQLAWELQNDFKRFPLPIEFDEYEERKALNLRRARIEEIAARIIRLKKIKMNNSQPIGIVTMEYDEQGAVTSATFVPTMKVVLDDNLIRQLQSLTASDALALQNNADLVMSAWFAKTNEIELADREEWTIKSRVVECITYPENGKVKKCAIEYTFVKKTAA